MNHLSLDKLSDNLLGQKFADLPEEEQRVIRHIHDRSVITLDSAELADAKATFGDRLADNVAAVGGSWGFIIAFSVVLFGWMALNSGVLEKVGLAFDPYPFIFLNLMLSTLAAVQAPIIMMSQNRQSAKDRIAAQHDYEVNLRAELEIIRLHAKIDKLLAAQVGSEHKEP